MGRYSSFSSRQDRHREKKEVHPIWRGVGLAMILLIPFLSYVASRVLLEENAKNNWFPLPGDLMVKGSDPQLLIKILLTVSIAFILYVLFMFVTFLLNRFFAPSRYGPLDVPQVSYKGKKKAR